AESSRKLKGKLCYRGVIPGSCNMKIAWVFLILLICAAAKEEDTKSCCENNQEVIKMLRGKMEETLVRICKLEEKVSELEGTIATLESKVANLTGQVNEIRLPIPPVCSRRIGKKANLSNRYHSDAETDGDKSTNSSWEYKSGVYKLKLGSQGIPVYCEMGIDECGSGGWTPVMKIDGRKSNLGYNSQYWSNKESFNPQGGTTGFDESETKLPSYWSTPFSKICLGMKVGDGTPKFILMNKTADSLYSLIADDKYRPTTLGSDTWKKLIETSSLQPHCNREGFNSICITAKARIGIHANQENDCKSCDSRIAFGATGHPDGSNKCGNVASYNGVHGRRRIKAMGYILVQ
ncbi:putative skeletal organic matrix protein 5, partial [Acropora cervicornis]